MIGAAAMTADHVIARPVCQDVLTKEALRLEIIDDTMAVAAGPN